MGKKTKREITNPPPSQSAVVLNMHDGTRLIYELAKRVK
jgi:hypothetical protein